MSGWTKRVPRHGSAVYAAVGVWGLALAGLGLVQTAWMALACLAAAGVADMISGVFRTAILQATAPAQLQGRLYGLELTVVAGGPALGDIKAGVVASLAGARVSLISGGLACIAGWA